jgi:hypothetical protein
MVGKVPAPKEDSPMATFSLRVSSIKQPTDSYGCPKANWHPIQTEEELGRVMGLNEVDDLEEDRHHSYEYLTDWMGGVGGGRKNHTFASVGDLMYEIHRVG